MLVNAITATSTATSNEPKNSSAALCITLSHIGKRFQPDFTHQSFEDERIPGHLPFGDLLETVQDACPSQSALATHELKLLVTLAPSCETSNVSIERRRRKRVGTIRNDNDTKSRENQKRIKRQSESTVIVTPSVDAEKENDDMSQSQQHCLSPDDILKSLQKALPPIVERDCTNDYLSEPNGTILQTWTTYEHRSFTITIADGSEADSYHSKLQNIALWFIETADNVDVSSDEDGGYWKVMYVFELIENKYALAGYMTLFHFYSPFKKPKSGIVVRICQALLLPPYQRMGLGTRIFFAVHDLVKASAFTEKEIVELNVEDPAPGFTALRNRVDYELLVKSMETGKEPWLPEKYWKNITFDDSNYFQSLVESDAVAAAAIGRVTPKQVHIALELYRFHAIRSKTDETTMTHFRLSVKKRLLKTHQEEVGACSTKEGRQTLLAALFDDLLQVYQQILTTA
jgi:histone acetyltransferase 1